ncbi:MAG: nucleotidyltransferase family protein, partial [Candidatus Bipolaricaulaceae bacterium]
RYGVREIAVFGSHARGDPTPASDVDLLVHLEKPLGLKFFELWDYLEQLLGAPVDLVTPEALSRKPRLWESIKDELVYV